MFTRIINTLFGDVKVHGGLAVGSPKYGSWRYTLDSIKRCPWADEITINRSDFIGTGAFDSVEGKAYHTVTCSADGPNPDDGKTFHHGSIGHWSDFKTKKEADVFCAGLMNAIEDIHGYIPPVYYSMEAKGNHAGWAMGGMGYKKPKTEWKGSI